MSFSELHLMQLQRNRRLSQTPSRLLLMYPAIV